MPVKPGQSRNLGLTPHVAGAGPLVGPVLAAQMGYLPGTLWILAGVVFAGAVQDMTVLFLSTRRDGRSLSDMVRSEMGPVAGAIAGIGVLLICVIVLAVLALVVVKALIGSPWGTFTVFCTVPIALIMGVFARFSNRPFGVKRFQTIHHYSVDVAHGLVLLFGIGTKALPAWDSRDEVEQSIGRPCRQTRRQVQGDIRTHLIHRPARDIIPPLGGARVFSYRN